MVIATGLIYGPIIFFVKLSILLLYFRIFSVNGTMRYMIYVGIAFQTVFYIAYFAVYVGVEVLCVSVEAVTRSYRYNNWKFVILQGAVNVATDFYVLCIPIAMVMRLQLTTLEKDKNNYYIHDRISVSLFSINFLNRLVNLIHTEPV